MHCFSVKWQSSGSPPSAFEVPYDSFRKECDSSVVDTHDISSPIDVVEKVKSKELDYDFICFFLSSQRVDLYRAIDWRCEDMVSGKWYCGTLLQICRPSLSFQLNQTIHLFYISSSFINNFRGKMSELCYHLQVLLIHFLLIFLRLLCLALLRQSYCNPSPYS